MKSNRNQSIILFDGVCNLCNGAVNFIIDRDVHHRFRFAALQSDIGQSLLRRHHFPPDFLESIVLIEQGQAFVKSTAALRIARKLRSPWPVCYGFIALPVFVRDFFYRIIAKYRYRIFGKTEACRYPTPELKEKFLV